MERTKRLYAAQDVDDLLRQLGIDYARYPHGVDHVTGVESYLPLSTFDNTEFESREPQEWIDLGTDEQGVTCVDAQALRSEDGRYARCHVLAYDEATREFTLRWVDEAEARGGDAPTVQLPRIHVCFDAEDPFLYAERVVTAHQLRRQFESSIRYNLFVDSMPTDEVIQLDSEQINRVSDLAHNTTALAQNVHDPSGLLREVKTDFARTMNKIIFDTMLRTDSSPETQALKDTLDLPPDQLSPAVLDPATTTSRVSGVVLLPPHDYPKHYSDFLFRSFFSQVEVIDALVKVNALCLEVREMSLLGGWSSNKSLRSKPSRLEDFEQQQNGTMLQLNHHLKENWLSSLKTSIQSSLRDVGKGWFNLKERSREVYMYSKLRKLLKLVNFMMEDSMRFMAERSLRDYARLIISSCRFDVHIEATDEVTTTFKPAPEGEGEGNDDGILPGPIFTVNLMVRDKTKIVFKHDAADFEASVLQCFDKSLELLLNIPQIEASVMQHLFPYGAEGKVAVVQRGEPAVNAVYEQMRATLRRALAPMAEYARLYNVYKPFLEEDMDKSIHDFFYGPDGFAVDDFRAEVDKHSAAIAELRQVIPQEIWVGVMLINCEDVQRQLIAKHELFVKKLLDGFATVTRQRCNEVNSVFAEIEGQLRREPTNIEELTEIRKYMEQVPLLVSKQQPAMDEVRASFALLESYRYKQPKDLFALHWRVFEGPKRAHTEMAEQDRKLEEVRQVFLQDMRSEQDQFQADLQDVTLKVDSFGQYTDPSALKQVYTKAEALQERLSELRERSQEFNSNEALFNLSCTDYKELDRTQRHFEPYYNVWTTTYFWKEESVKWMQGPFTELDPIHVEDSVARFGKSMAKATKSPAVRDNPGLSAMASGVRKQIADFKPLLPLVASLRQPGMRQRHWEALSEALPFDLVADDSLTLHKCVHELRLQEHMTAIQRVGETASKEYQIESALDKMEAAWVGIDFEVTAYKDTGTYVISGVDEIVALLDEHLVMTQAMQFSAFKKEFEDRIDDWEKKLRLVSDVIDEWMGVQRQWLSLQPIFASPDINQQLPAEGKRFSQVHKTWKLIMSNAHNSPAVLNYCNSPPLLIKLRDANKMLDAVQKRLADYLDSKRAAFARFYFLSNDELLQILSQTRDPTAVQAHLKKCFENIERLRFDGPDNQITHMYSSKGEEVPLAEPIHTKGKNVEFWLGEVEEMMKRTMRRLMCEAIADYADTPRTDWVRKWPGMCVLNGSQYHWTRQVEEALQEHGSVREYHEHWMKQLMTMVSLVRGDLSKIERTTMGALIVLDVHARDVLERLVRENVATVQDFAWICQMRYYLDRDDGPDKGLSVQMVQSRFPYGYEYLGNSLRLVITPLTDRCYMTLMAALQLHLGGAPAGPAGTGKTETVKDLAKAVAKQCVVFNCSDGLDYLAMGKFFKGLASAGAWACFDEFNRIDIEVLSVVAQQIMTIWAAVRQSLPHFVFEGSDIPLDPTCSVFITMNPGYAGRTELPDNLKALFRPVAMMVPDYALIAEIMLYSFGFNQARKLAGKMTATFKLSSEQLSAQDHYDYGMRAVKTVITRAGILKREEPDADEAVLVLRALRDVNVPKFLSDDLPLFEGIISDLFPGVTKPESDYGALMNAIVLTAAEKRLQPEPSFLNKCIQLYETTVVRHGLMLVGPTGGGKTATLHTLRDAITSLESVPGFQPIDSFTINPKSVTMGQLYGEFDENTHEWTDGILANMVRNCIEAPLDRRKWVVFDGPVDAIWIENMNTVLDDNKKLCLVSGEILQLTSAMTMIFEVEDLEVASPATVSRCGMVYMEPSQLGLWPLVVSWLESLPPVLQPLRARYETLFQSLLESSIQFVRNGCVEPVPTVDNNLAESCMRLLDCFLVEYAPLVLSAAEKELAESGGDGEGGSFRERMGQRARVGDEDETDQQLQRLLSHMDALFVLALVWSVGATTTNEGRAKFDRFLRLALAQENMSDPLPPKGMVFDFAFNMETGVWEGWMDSQAEFSVAPGTPFSEIIVPTVDSVRYTYVLDMLVRNNMHALVTGNTGTGKSVNVTRFLAGLPETLSPVNVTFSAATSANQTEEMLFSKLDKRRKNMYGPPIGKRFVVFVDDMNMPAREKYFAQPPIELLRQWMDHGGWYDRQSLEFVNIVDISFIGAMGPPGGGRNPVTRRFLRHFNQIAHTDLSDASLALIFNTVMAASMSAFEDKVSAMASATVQATLEVYETITRELLPTPSKSHYTFNLRDLSKVVQGLLTASPKHVTTSESFLRLWVHENRRVFQDRLINDDDREWLDKLLARVMESRFEGTKWADVVESAGSRIIFGDFLDRNEAVGARPYREANDPDELVRVMNDALAEYNEENNAMNLVMFLDAIEHVSRISRVLRQPQGNALLLGVGGSGRQSLTRLAAYLADYSLFQIEIAKNYSVDDWHDSVRSLLLSAGLKQEPTVFLFNDTQIVHESMLEDVNNILNSGDVPALFAPDDMDSIFHACKIDCQRKNIPATKMNTYKEFVARVQKNLHVVLCMSPLGDTFRTRLRMFPSLVNCCTIDWFSAWPSQALSSVAMHSLASSSNDGNDLGALAEDVLPGVVRVMEQIHMSVSAKSIEYREELRRYNYVTPTSYLELLSIFHVLLKERREEVGGLRDKLQNGLDKLADTAQKVAMLQQELTEKQPILVKTQAEVSEMMVEISHDKEQAAETKEQVEAQEREAQEKAEECKAIRDDAQRDLDRALPLLDEAVECLAALSKKDLDEVRALKRPPSGVVLTMEAMCIMLRTKPLMKQDPDRPGKKKPDYWETARIELLGDVKELLHSLRDYDKDNIPESVIKKIRPYVEREDFQVDVVKKASQACMAIAMWVHAMYNYYNVSREVEPKRIRLRQAEEDLGVVEAALKVAKERLADVMDRIRVLTENYEAAVAKQEALSNEVHRCEVQLDRAEKLIGGLGGEKVRWTAKVQTLSADYENIVGDVIVASGTVAYLGAFTSSYRDALTQLWREQLTKVGIAHTESCSIRSTLGDPVTIREWNLCGLPTDAVSTENGIIMSKAQRWPLMIDPQGQAGKFVRQLGAKQTEDNMDVIKATSTDLLRTMENAVRFGRWVLLEGLGEELDPGLEPVLTRAVFLVNGQPHIKVGDSAVPYSPSFRFYMTTKLPNPHYAPELQVKVTLLNFTITPQGLRDQMLGTVVATELPEQEDKRNELLVNNARMQAELKNIEDTILRMLKESQGDILDDEELIDTLTQSKKTSIEITERVAESAEIEKEIDSSRRAYTPVAVRASILYFAIADLAAIDPMYQYSLQWFVQLFVNAISEAEAADDIEQRLENLNTYFTRNLYENVCRSLFEKHKLLFSFLLTVRILQEERDEYIRPEEWRTLVAGGTSKKEVENPAPEWLTESAWASILNVSDLERFEGLERSFLDANTRAQFRAIFDDPEPQDVPLPSPWDERLNDFCSLLVLRALRPDRMTSATRNFVRTRLGESFIQSPPFDLAHSFKASSSVTPLVFILSRGADPAAQLTTFAGEVGFRDKMASVSLGQGQGQIAEALIAEAQRHGTWVLLQNCHLALSWLPELERIVEETNEDEVHPEYRLWLTSMPTPKFPVSILQNSAKVTNEPPQGLRANLERSYLGFSAESLEESKNPHAYKKLLFSLCLFNAIVLDRRRFGPLGLNKPYQFTETDLAVSITQLREFLELYDEVPYQVIHFLIYDVHFGGRVTDDIDRRTISTILDDFINPDVLSDEYKFSPSGKYVSIPAGNKKDYLKYIRSLDLAPKPEVFGLHDNADITRAQESTLEFFSTILKLLPRSGGSRGGKSREEIISDTATQVLQQLPDEFDLTAISQRYPTKYEQSMNTVLIQEAIRYNRLIRVMRRTLRDLKKALVGELVMDETLESMADALFTNLVPETWEAVAYPSLMPLAAWVSDLVARLNFIADWVENGIPNVLWISGFYFPQAFLTGTLQNYARKHAVPIDSVQFAFKVLDTPWEDIKEPPEDGVYIRGLFLEGARWDAERHTLAQSRPKELFTQMPVIWLKPEPVKEDAGAGDSGAQKQMTYRCPVYKILTRRGQLSTTGHSTNFIVFIELPTDVSPRVWIKAGVACFAALRY